MKQFSRGDARGEWKRGLTWEPSMQVDRFRRLTPELSRLAQRCLTWHRSVGRRSEGPILETSFCTSTECLFIDPERASRALTPIPSYDFGRASHFRAHCQVPAAYRNTADEPCVARFWLGQQASLATQVSYTLPAELAAPAAKKAIPEKESQPGLPPASNLRLPSEATSTRMDLSFAFWLNIKVPAGR